MSVEGFIKNIRNEMRNDAGISGDAQRLEQMTWMIFLKVYDIKEEEWELMDKSYTSIIPEEYRWTNWAHDNKDGKCLTGDDLLRFINDGLFPTLKNLPVDEDTPIGKSIVANVFQDINNYMKDGVLLRKIVNIIDAVDFYESTERHLFNDIYESMLKELQSQGSSGEFYTPRAVTDFMVEMVDPVLGESIADFACGTGGFLTSTLKHLSKQKRTSEDIELFNNSIYGVEKKPFPYLLCITNMLIHDVDTPRIYHANSLERDVLEYSDEDRFDVIVMNPPYGGSEKEVIKNNFPTDLTSSETADLFMSVIMYRLKRNGRAAVILPDGLLFGTEGAKRNIKEKLMREFNLHTVIRMPASVFAPYTSITTNILFFDNTSPTRETWFYRMDMPEGYKHFSKTKPIRNEHFDAVRDWWNDRTDVIDDKGFQKARCYTVEEIADGDYNLDLCKYPQEKREILPPHELISEYRQRRSDIESKMNGILEEIEMLLNPDTSQ
ncbi:MAG: SAM-dependent DNA methyltransferase [Thermoplasmata archaeon]|nr:SAM-dependent DNA methyltransferase [Thermoplasmata archaeon]